MSIIIIIIIIIIIVEGGNYGNMSVKMRDVCYGSGI